MRVVIEGLISEERLNGFGHNLILSYFDHFEESEAVVAVCKPHIDRLSHDLELSVSIASLEHTSGLK